jgi:hypothetical protein
MFAVGGWCAAPIVSFTDRWNIGRTGDGSVTISGMQFGLVGLSPTASLEDSLNHPCSCTSWMTGTAVVCNVQASRAGLMREAMTIGGAVGTRTQKFTFDGKHASNRLEYHTRADGTIYLFRKGFLVSRLRFGATLQRRRLIRFSRD